MSEFTVEGECSDIDVEVGENQQPVISVDLSHDAEVVVENIYEVEAQINEWQLVNDMIYVVQEYGEIPDWLETAINEILTDENGLLVDSLEELKALFDQFEEGYNARVISLENENESQNTYISSLVSRTDDNAAAIIHIDDTYVSETRATAISTQIVGAYLNDGELGGAWFENSVSAVADVAYSAARSSSSLNAVIQSQAAQIGDIYGTLEEVSKQIDGTIVTWFIRRDDPGDGTYYDPVGPVIKDINNNNIPNPDGKPYWCWLPGNICPEDIYLDDTTEDTRAEHTGDTYVWYENDAEDNKVILSTWRFGKDPDSDDYNWFVFTDDLASEAYQAALNAQTTADGKINTYFLDRAPTLTDAGLQPGQADLMNGDIWYDATIVGWLDPLTGDTNFEETPVFTDPIYDGTMRRYYGITSEGVPLPDYDAANWIEVTDAKISASVKRLDQATVTIDGVATAKGSLVVEATGSSGETAVSGYLATADSDQAGAQSAFRVFADKFEVANTETSLPVFEIDSSVNPAEITFTGKVEFGNVLNPPVYEEPDLTPYMTTAYADEFFTRFTDLSTPATTTIINGANIRTGKVLADYMSVTQLSALTADLGIVNAGVMYNSGANSTNYTMMVNLDSGEIHIR